MDDLLLGTLAVRGKQSVAEACAKHLKAFIETTNDSASAVKEHANTSAKALASQTLPSPFSITVGSTPVGADIYVDDEFVGNTPSTINVQRGKHAIAVKKAGFQDWARDINVSGGSVNLSAELQSGGAPAATGVSVKKDFTVNAVPSLQSKASSSDPQPGWIGLLTKSVFGGGVQVVAVAPDGPASKGGLRAGDIITQVNGVNVGSQDDFDARISRHGPGSTLRIGYMRSAWAFETKVTVDKVPM
jgi:hypothetical protein